MSYKFALFQQFKDELGFWDSAVTAVLTEKTAVSSQMTQPTKPDGPESEKVRCLRLIILIAICYKRIPGCK